LFNGLLGVALQDQGKLAEAVAEYRTAIAVEPACAEAHNFLGTALAKQGKPAEAEAAWRKALEIKPGLGEAHNNLGRAMRKRGKLAEAVAAHRRAIALKPDLASLHNNLGLTLAMQGNLAEAEAACRKAVALKPDYAGAHNDLGITLKAQGKLAEAMEAWRKSIDLDPDYAMAYYNLGHTLWEQGNLAEAEAAYRKGLARKPDAAPAGAHFELGCVLVRQGKWPEAATAFRRATALNPDSAEAHCNLGHALREVGHLEAALAELRRGHELGSRRPGWPYPSAQWVKDCERLTAPVHFRRGMALVVTTDRFRQAAEELRRAHELSAGDPNGPDPSGLLLRRVERLAALESRLPALLKGRARPAGPEEQLCLAWLCQFRGDNAAAARWYGEAFAARPALGEDLATGDRYDGACAAALAGCGQGADARTLGEKERARLREQALAWLRADLAAWGKLLEKDPGKARAAVSRMLRHWLADPDFNGVRGRPALGRLPESERRAWQALWQEVKAVYLRVAPPRVTARRRP
jgi:tetratricopeptide (TPR) repeat protein